MVKCPAPTIIILNVGLNAWVEVNRILPMEMAISMNRMNMFVCVGWSVKTNQTHERIEDQLSHYGTY